MAAEHSAYGQSATSLRLRRPASLAVGAFTLLATLYSIVTPLFEAPDEVWHFRFITHVAATATLPTQYPTDAGPWRQEGSQPPLYYLLIAALVAPIDTSDIDLLAQPNPHAAIGRADGDGNVNFAVHTPDERFPWRGAALAAHVARFVSVLLGATTVYLTYLLAYEFVSRDRIAPDVTTPEVWALGAALLVALNPQFLFISGAINNDNLIITLATLTLVILLRLVNVGVSERRLLLLGVVIGLAALTKLSGLGLWGLAAVVLIALAWQRRDPVALLRWSGTVFTSGALVAGWWYVRNWMLYGDPTGLNVMLATFGQRTEPVSALQLAREFQGLRWSFWAVFGWFNVLPPRWVHGFFDLLALLGLIGLAIVITRRIRARDWPTLARLALLASWLGITVAALGGWTTLTSATQGRLLFPAIAVIGVLVFTGLATLTPAHLRSHLTPVLGVALGGVALYLGLGVIRPAYSPPPALSPEQLDGLAPPSDGAVFDDRIAVLGYEVVPAAVQPGDDLTVTLYWRGLAPIPENYSLFIHLVGENEIIVSQRDSHPGRGSAPTAAWSPGLAFEDRYRLHVPATTAAPQTARVVVGLYRAADGRRLSLADGTERLPLKSVRVVEAASEAGVPNPVDFNLGGQVKLVGYELSARTAQPGDTIALVLYWQALTDINQDYTVFTQLQDDEGEIWAQDDSQPQRGAYPTSGWRPGETVWDTYDLTIEPDTPPGIYHLQVGMYLLDTGDRLYRTDEPTANSIRVADIRVGGSH